MRKKVMSLYATRNIKTNKIEDIMIKGAEILIDEDRTGFYLECNFIDNKGGNTEKFINELIKMLKK